MSDRPPSNGATEHIADASDGRSVPVGRARSTDSAQRRAFLTYKQRVADHGKPFFPYGVFHDVIAATVVVAIIIAVSWLWFAQANCDSLWNVWCDRVSTPLEQEHYTPGDPGSVERNDQGEAQSERRPLLGPLYEEKADPATTSYHPRPEWYFYFLFYLLIVFSNPQLVLLGTIGVPTLWLMMLIALPFVDRRKERRPSRRPIAMAAMMVTSVFLLAFTYLGSQQGKEETGGPAGLTAEQQEMEGYRILFEEGVFDQSCSSCHQLGGIGNGGVGPVLDDVGTRYDDLDGIIEVLAFGKGGGSMPPRGNAELTDEQVAQVSAFLKTLGDAGSTGDPALSGAGGDDYARVTGEGGSDGESGEGTAGGDEGTGGADGAQDGGDPSNAPGDRAPGSGDGAP